MFLFKDEVHFFIIPDIMHVGMCRFMCISCSKKNLECSVHCLKNTESLIISPHTVLETFKCYNENARNERIRTGNKEVSMTSSLAVYDPKTQCTLMHVGKE